MKLRCYRVHLLLLCVTLVEILYLISHGLKMVSPSAASSLVYGDLPNIKEAIKTRVWAQQVWETHRWLEAPAFHKHFALLAPILLALGEVLLQTPNNITAWELQQGLISLSQAFCWWLYLIAWMLVNKYDELLFICRTSWPGEINMKSFRNNTIKTYWINLMYSLPYMLTSLLSIRNNHHQKAWHRLGFHWDWIWTIYPMPLVNIFYLL